MKNKEIKLKKITFDECVISVKNNKEISPSL